MIKTIAKNRKHAIDSIFTAAKSCKCYSLNNNFVGVDCSPETAQQELYRYDFAKLRQHDDAEYCVQIHSNLWFEIYIN